MSKSGVPVLCPVEVPWQASPSAPLERFTATEETVDLDLVVFLGQHVVDQEIEARELAKEPIDDATYNRLGYRDARLSFHGIAAWRASPPQLPHALIDESSYDISELTAAIGSASPPRREAFRKVWRERGLCPDPRFYEVTGSSWKQALGLERSGARHWMVLGHSMVVEILATGFTCSLAHSPHGSSPDAPGSGST
jgi:hypothetical protein